MHPRVDTSESTLLMMCWGKAAASEGLVAHPALLHMLDVAAVAIELLRLPALQVRSRLLLQPRPGVCLRIEALGLLVALHDLGKISPGFQVKVPALAAPLQDLGLAFGPLACGDHGRVGAALLGTELIRLELAEDVAFAAGRAVASHHGWVTPDSAMSTDAVGDAGWHNLRMLAVDRLAALLPVGQLTAIADVPDAWVATLAGLTSVADWVGSNTMYFEYQPDADANGEYLKTARHKARRALKSLGWSGWRPPSVNRPFSELFPFAPNPLQRGVAQVADDARLLILEAPTGCGKTEAALCVAERWLVADQGAGLFFALPTQATSNQMVNRVAEFLAHSYPDARVNLHLAHGAASINPTYQALRMRSVDGPGQTPGSVVADHWFASRKRTMLAPFSVGTIDQGLLAVLQCRHGMVRLYGLSGKVMVIDEVHAYDAFMSRILERLLEWLRALDCRVVLLSATLPPSQRTALLQAWGADAPNGCAGQHYPRVTCTKADSTSSVIQLAPPPSKQVNLGWRPGDETALDTAAELMRQVAKGGCAAWVCNTVGRAQACASALLELGWPEADLIVFHARMPHEVRIRIEGRLTRILGKHGERVSRLIVVATQVVEQSLDIDFDTMVSDLAPVDLLLQRAGRLWRHNIARPSHIESARFTVVAPSGDPDSPDFGTSRFVYHPHILLRTWLTLGDRTAWSDPGDIDELVAAVYEPTSPPSDAVAEAWHETLSDLQEHRRGQRSASSRDLLPKPMNSGEVLDKLHAALDDDVDAGLPAGRAVRTRDIDQTVRLLCLATDDDGAIRAGPSGPLVDLGCRPSQRDIVAVLGRSLTVSHRSWVRRLMHTELPPAWANVGALRGARVLVFNQEGVAMLGTHRLHLHPLLGLCLGGLSPLVPPEASK